MSKLNNVRQNLATEFDQARIDFNERWNIEWSELFNERYEMLEKDVQKLVEEAVKSAYLDGVNRSQERKPKIRPNFLHPGLW